MSESPIDIDKLVDESLLALRKEAGGLPISVFVDPVLSDPLAESSDFKIALSRGTASKIRLPFIHADIDPQRSPYLLHVADEANAERLIATSIRLAFAEARGEMGDGYLGRSVCAWICSNSQPQRLAERLARLARVTRPDGKPWPFRFWDPRVLWHLPRVLTSTDWDMTSAVLASWWTITPMLRLTPMSPCPLKESNDDADIVQPHPEVRSSPLRFDLARWQRLERIGTTNKALALASGWGMPPTQELAQQIENLLMRCTASGFEGEQDGLVYVACGLTSHERFGEHPELRQALALAASERSSVAAALQSFDDKFWSAVSVGQWLANKNASLG